MAELEQLSQAYETAEALFLTAVRGAADRGELALAARQVASAAAAYDAEAYRELHASEGDAWDSLDHLTERTGVLRELWEDLAAAYAA